MNEPILSEARLLEIMAQARRDQEAEAGAFRQEPGSHPIPLARARELALDPRRWTEAERAHAATCRHCARLVAVFEREMPHPSLWELLLWKGGIGGEAEKRRMAYHVEEGGCRRCRERLERWRDAFGSLPAPTPLPHPEALRADTEFPEIAALALDARLEADLVQEDGTFLLEVRTKDAALKHHLVGFLIIGDAGREPLTGFVALRPDRNDWLAATAAFSHRELYDALGSARILVMPMDAADLTGDDAEALLASARRGRLREAERDAWLVWAARQEDNALAQAVMEAVRRQEGDENGSVVSAMSRPCGRNSEPAQPRHSLSPRGTPSLERLPGGAARA